MRLQNVTIVLLVKITDGFKVKSITENPELPTANGKPVIGHYQRRLMTVKEVVARTGMSKGKAAEARRTNPIAYLADFGGQEPLIAVKAA